MGIEADFTKRDVPAAIRNMIMKVLIITWPMIAALYLAVLQLSPALCQQHLCLARILYCFGDGLYLGLFKLFGLFNPLFGATNYSVLRRAHLSKKLFYAFTYIYLTVVFIIA